MSHPPRQQERTDAALRKGGKGNSGFQKQGVPISGKSGGAGPSGGLRNPPPASRSNKRTTNGSTKGISASEPTVVNSQTASLGAQPNQQRAIPIQRHPTSAGDVGQAASLTESGEGKGGAPSSAVASLPPMGTTGRGGPVATSASHAVGTGQPPSAMGLRTTMVPASSGGSQSSMVSVSSSNQVTVGGEVFAKASGNSSRPVATATHFQFGSLPQFGGMQIPARTNSAPPNLIEQRNEQAQFEAASSVVVSKPTVVVAPQQVTSKSTVVAASVSHTANVHSQTNMQSVPNHAQLSQPTHMQQAQGASMPVHASHPSHAQVQQMVVTSQQQQSLGQHHQKQQHQQQMQSGTGPQSLPPQSLGGQMTPNMPSVGQAGKFGQGHMMPAAHVPPMLSNQLGHIAGPMAMQGAFSGQYANNMSGPTHPSMSGGGGLQPRTKKPLLIVDPTTREAVEVNKRESLATGAGSDGGIFVPGSVGIGPGQQQRGGVSGSVPGTSPVLRPPQVAFQQPPMMPPLQGAYYTTMGPGGQPMSGQFYGPGQAKQGVGVQGPPGPSSGSPPVRFYSAPSNGVPATHMPFMPHAAGPGVNGMKLMNAGPELAPGAHGTAIIHGMPGVNMVPNMVPVGVPVRPGIPNSAMHGGGVASAPRPVMPLQIGSPLGMPITSELTSPNNLPPGFLSSDVPSQAMVSHGPQHTVGMMIPAENNVANIGHRRQMDSFSPNFNNNLYRNSPAARPVVNVPQRSGAVGPKPSTPPTGPGNQGPRLSATGSAGFVGGQVTERGKSIEPGRGQGGSVPIAVGGQGQAGGKKKKEQQRQQQQQALQQKTPGQPHPTVQPSVVPGQHGSPSIATATEAGAGSAEIAGVVPDKSSASVAQAPDAHTSRPFALVPSGPTATHDRRSVQSSTAPVPASTRPTLDKPSEGEDAEKPAPGKPVLVKGGAWLKGPPGSGLPPVEPTPVVVTRTAVVPPKGSLSEALSLSGPPATDVTAVGPQPRASTSGRENYAGQVREVREQAWESVGPAKAPYLAKHEPGGTAQVSVDKLGVGARESDKSGIGQDIATEVYAPVTLAWAAPGSTLQKVSTAPAAPIAAPALVPGKQTGLKKDEGGAVVSGPPAKSGGLKEAGKQASTSDGRSVDGIETKSIAAPAKKLPAIPAAAAAEVTEVAPSGKEARITIAKVEDEKVPAGIVTLDVPTVPASSSKIVAQGKDGAAGKEPLVKETSGKSTGGKDGGKRGGKGRDPSHEPKVLPAEILIVTGEEPSAGAVKELPVSEVAPGKEAKAGVPVASKGAVGVAKDVGMTSGQKDSLLRGSGLAKEHGGPAGGKDASSAASGEDVQRKDAEEGKVDAGKGEVSVKKATDSFRQARNVPPKKRPTQAGGDATMAESKKDGAQEGEKVVATAAAAKAPAKDGMGMEKEGEALLKATEADHAPFPAKPSAQAVSVPGAGGEEKQGEGKTVGRSKDPKAGGKGKDGKKSGEAGQAGKGDKKSVAENAPESKVTAKVDIKAPESKVTAKVDTKAPEPKVSAKVDTKGPTHGPVKAEASKSAAKEDAAVSAPIPTPAAVLSPAGSDVVDAKTTPLPSESGALGSASVPQSAPSVAPAKVSAGLSSDVEKSVVEGGEDGDAMADFADVFAVESSKEPHPRGPAGKVMNVSAESAEKGKAATPVDAKGPSKPTGKQVASAGSTDDGPKEEAKKQLAATSLEDKAPKKSVEGVAQETVAVKGLAEGKTVAVSQTAVPAQPSREVDLAGSSGVKADAEADENGTVTPSGLEAAVTKPSASDAELSSVPAAGSKKKKLKDALARADAESKNAGDLYNAYKAPVEAAKMKEAAPAEIAAKEKPAPALEEASSKELDDWEDAADMPTPRIGKKVAGGAGSQGVAGGPEGSSGGGEPGSQKYTRDFLLTFRDSNLEMPADFDYRDFLELLQGDATRSVGPGGLRPGTPGRGGPALNMEDERWTRGAGGRFPEGVLPGQPGGFRPGGGPPGRGGLMGPGGRGMLGSPHMGYPPGGPFPPGMGPPGMMGRGGTNGIDADRWARNPQMARGPGPPPRMNVPGPAIHKLAEEKRFVVGVVTDEDQVKQKKVKGILNKLTPQNFDKLFEQVKEVGIDSAGSLSNVISQIFEKALFEPKFCEMYAQFCQKLSTEMPEFTEDNEKFTFRRVLLNKCQEEFERGKSEEADAEREDVAEGAPQLSRAQKEEKLNKARQRTLGNIRLIGELYKKNMLTERIMHMCIQSLLGDVNATLHEEQIEALCKLMATIGGMIDHPKAKSHMDSYFQRMDNEANNEKLSLRHRFMLRDVIELRACGWQERRKVDGPKKIADVHRDYVQERSSAVAAATASIQRGDRTSGGRDRRGDRGPPPPQMRGGPMGGGFQPGGGGGRGPRGQDARGEADSMMDAGRYAGPARPLQAQRPSDDGDVRLGPQGGLGRGMGGRGHGPGMGSGPGRDNFGMGGARGNIPMSPAQSGHGMMGMGPHDRGPGGGPDHGFMGQDRGSFRGGRGVESPSRGGRPDEHGGSGRGFFERPAERPFTPDRGPRGLPVGGHGTRGPDRGYERGDSRPSSRDGREGWSAKGGPAVDRAGSSGQGAPALNVRPATPPHGSRVQAREPLSEADCIDKGKYMFMEFSRTEDLKEVDICMEELRASEFHSKMVYSWIDQAIQKKDKERVALSKLILHLNQTSLLSKEDIFKGFVPFLNDLDDMAVDAPKAPEQVAAMLGACIAAGILSLADVGRSIINAGPEDAPHTLIEGGRGLEMLGHILARIRQEKGDEDTAAFFKASGLNVENFMTDVEKRKANILEMFLEANRMLDPMIPVQRHLAEALSKDEKQADIIKWLEEHVPSSMSSDAAYSQMVLKEVMNKIFPREVVAAGGGDLKKYAVLLKRVAGEKASRSRSVHQVQYVFALQNFAHELDHPSGFLNRTFDDLYQSEVVDEDAYMKWKDDNKDTTPGKVQALKDTAPFFKWLDEAEEEEN